MCILCKAHTLNIEYIKRLRKLKVCEKCDTNQVKYLELFTNLTSLKFEGGDMTNKTLESVKKLPKLSKKLKSLTLPYNCAVDEIPDYLTELEFLDICCSLKNLPPTLTKLKVLHFDGVGDLEEIPKEYVNLVVLELNQDCFSDNDIITKIPSTLINLKILRLSHMSNLIEIPSTLINLKILDLDNIQNLKEIPLLPKLDKLRLWVCQSISYIPKFERIKEVCIHRCNKLKYLHIMSNNIKEFIVRYCNNLRIVTATDEKKIKHMKYENYSHCPKLIYSPNKYNNKLIIDNFINCINKFIKSRRFTKWTHTKQFAEHYYNPQHNIGKMMKRRMYSELNELAKNIPHKFLH